MRFNLLAIAIILVIFLISLAIYIAIAFPIFKIII
jgi:hypothetical protein